MTEAVTTGVLMTLEAPPPTAFAWTDMLFPVAMIAIVYFMIMRPQAQAQAEQQALVASLMRDDAVVTRSGLHGVVVGVEGDVAIIEVAPGVHVRVDKDAVVRRAGAASAASK